MTYLAFDVWLSVTAKMRHHNTTRNKYCWTASCTSPVCQLTCKFKECLSRTSPTQAGSTRWQQHSIGWIMHTQLVVSPAMLMWSTLGQFVPYQHLLTPPPRPVDASDVQAVRKDTTLVKEVTYKIIAVGTAAGALFFPIADKAHNLSLWCYTFAFQTKSARLSHLWHHCAAGFQC